MDYNFTSISNDVIVDLEKKKRKMKDNVMSEIANFLHVLNDQEIIDRSGEMNQEISDILSDEINVATKQFTETMMKVQVVLRRYL